MAGISSKALGAGGNDNNCGCPNKKGFNGNEIQNREFSDGSGLEVYDFNARTYDPQIGRFIQIDSLLEEGGQESLSPYHFTYNNPVRFNDPDGKCPICPAIPIIIQGAKMIGAGLVALYGAYQTHKAIEKLKEENGGTLFNRDNNNGAIKVESKKEEPKKDITIDPKDKIDRELLNSPYKPGNAPTFKKDNKRVEIHHEGQNPNGPFKEMHPNDHRGKGNDKKNHPNKSKPSQIDRKEFQKQKEEYWKKEFPPNPNKTTQ